MIIKPLILSFHLLSFNLFAGTASIKVIYGDDDRVDVVDAINPIHLKLSESTAAMISPEKLIEYNSLQFELAGRTLQDTGICESERFSNQPVNASCSGFLVSENLLVTAGHCVQTENDCKNKFWVFDYKVERESDSRVIVDKSNVYKCSRIVSQKLDSDSLEDYAVIKLERDVTDRAPLKFRDKGLPSVGDDLVVIGHPSGLPTKIADGANIRSVNKVYFVANLDTYGGNSGSAVFNATTGIVEGILVRGETDYITNRELGCRESNRLADDEGDGEEVNLITIVKGLPKIKPPKPPRGQQPEMKPDEHKLSHNIFARIARFFRRLFS